MLNQLIEELKNINIPFKQRITKKGNNKIKTKNQTFIFKCQRLYVKSNRKGSTIKLEIMNFDSYKDNIIS